MIAKNFEEKTKSPTSSSLDKNNVENKVVRSQSNNNTSQETQKHNNIHLLERKKNRIRAQPSIEAKSLTFSIFPIFNRRTDAIDGIKATSWFIIGPNYQPLLHFAYLILEINPYSRLNPFEWNTTQNKTKQIYNIQLNKTK